MPPKLHAIVAVEAGVKSRAESEQTTLMRAAHNTGLVTGLRRTYQTLIEGGVVLPDEGNEVVIKHRQVLDQLAATLTPYYDVTATKEASNQHAKADVVVDGTTLIADAPVGLLLFLERKLGDLVKVIAAFPVTDPAVRWTWDADQELYVADEVKTIKQGKVMKVLIKYAATPEHPAQTEPYTADEAVGEWKNIRLSGAVSPGRKRQLLERVNRVLVAVQKARAQANEVDATEREIGADLFGYLFAETGSTPAAPAQAAGR